MLVLRIRTVRPDQEDNLRSWLSTVQSDRREEAVATLIDESVRHEMAVLVPNRGNPLLVYAMEVDDPNQARRSAVSGRHTIDAEHRDVLGAALGDDVASEVLLDLRID